MKNKLEIKKTTVLKYRTRDRLEIEARASAKMRKESDRKRHEQNRINNLKNKKK